MQSKKFSKNIIEYYFKKRKLKKEDKENKDFNKKIEEWEQKNKKEKNNNKKISSDKFKEIKKAYHIIFKEDKNNKKIISFIGNHGSGKSLVINKLIENIKLIKNKKNIYINIDVWELFGLRSYKDYKGELKTACSVHNEKLDRKIYSYCKENKNEDFATKLNIRKIMWRNIISKILIKNKNSNIIFRFKLRFKLRFKMKRRINKILENNNKEKVNIYKLKIIISILFLIGVSILISIAIFIVKQNNIILQISSLLGPIISIFTPNYLIFSKKSLKIKENIDINEFLLDESNFIKIKEWIKFYLGKRKLFIHVDNIDRLLSWLDNKKETKDSSLIVDIIQTLHLMYSIKNVNILYEINDDVIKNVNNMCKNGDIVNKIFVNFLKIKSISNNDIEKYFYNEKIELNKMQKLFANDYYNTIKKYNPNHLSYRLLKTEYIPNFKELIKNRNELIEENEHFYEDNAYKSQIRNFLFKKNIINLEINNKHFTWEKENICVFDEANEVKKPLNNIFKWMNGTSH